MSMKVDIENFLREVCPQYGLSANYRPDKNFYVVHKRGYSIQNFTPKQFYEIPKPKRKQMFLALMKRGLTHNLGEGTLKNKLHSRSSFGTRIV